LTPFRQNSLKETVSGFFSLMVAKFSSLRKPSSYLLCRAAELGLSSVVDSLINNNRQYLANATNDQGETPLMIASYEGHTKTVRTLLDFEGIEINLRDNDGNTALFYAIDRGHLEIVRIILKKSGSHLGMRDILTNLFKHPRLRDFDMLNAIADEMPDVDVNFDFEKGNSILHTAVAWGKVKTVRAILRFENVDVNMLNDKGVSPLEIACRNKAKQSIIKALLAHPNIQLTHQVVDKAIKDNLRLLAEHEIRENILNFARLGFNRDWLGEMAIRAVSSKKLRLSDFQIKIDGPKRYVYDSDE
jgi:ankyrin repeat protein